MSATRPSVVYWNNIPSPYTVDRFNAVARRGNIEFEAWFNDRIEPDRSWDLDEADWEFPHRYVRRLSGSRGTLHAPPPLYSRRLPDLLISLYAEPVFLAGWALARSRGIRTAFWAEVTFDRWVERRARNERIKRLIFPRVDGVLTCGAEGRAWVARYGAPRDRLQHIVQGIDIDHFAGGSRLGSVERDELRARLGVHGVAFMYVGRLWQGKGLETLVEAFGLAQREADGKVEMSLLLVGDGAEETALREQVQRVGAQNVLFPGFRQKPALPAMHGIADVFVFPTLGDPYGLAVNEAMAAGLPVISTTAAGEIRDRIRPDVTGLLVPPGDAVALAARIGELAMDAGRREDMGRAAAEEVAWMTTDAYAASLETAAERILAADRRGGPRR